MDEHDWMAGGFEANRTHLRAVAYRMLGSVSEADDAVQEAWLRLSRTDASQVENLGGWLTPGGAAGRRRARVAPGASLALRRSRSGRREEPLEPLVPEPIVSADTDPERQALIADS